MTQNEGNNGKKKRRGGKAMKIVLITILGLIFIIVVLAISFVYNNLNYNDEFARRVKTETMKAGFSEKQVALEDGTVLNYAEGPKNGPALLLIHGQGVSWEDYSTVLPELSKHFHIYAIDCHGHGESSKNPEKYTAEAIGKDFIRFIEKVIGEPAVVSGHSSGGLLTAWLAANSPKNVRGIVLEDPPFFSTESNRTEKTYAWADSFRNIHNFLNQSEEKDYVLYYLKNSYWKSILKQFWNEIVKYATTYRKEHPNEKLKIFFVPPAISRIWDFISDDYDLRFGDSFYDCSWFRNFNQAETLAKINCPSVLIHTSWQYDTNGILLAAMDENDAQRAHSLIKNNELIDVVSGHDVHFEKPEVFIRIMTDFLKKIQ